MSKWNEARLLRLIRDQIEEGADLEYKGARALGRDQKEKEEITKDVSAMANAAGGTIIYGIAEFSDPARKHLPEKIDPVSRKDFSKEWLEQIISKISPRIPGLLIHPVKLSSGLNDVAYVVEVPKGQTAHQALTFRYHRRHNFEVLAMLHQEVLDVLNRRKVPQLEIEITATLVDMGHGLAYRMIGWLVNNADSAATAYNVGFAIKKNELPPDWDIYSKLWQEIYFTDDSRKWNSVNSLNPGEKQILAKWLAGDGQAPLKNQFSKERGWEDRPFLKEAWFTKPYWEMHLNLFGKDQSPMSFLCRFEKKEIEKQSTKRFRPLAEIPVINRSLTTS